MQEGNLQEYPFLKIRMVFPFRGFMIILETLMKWAFSPQRRLSKVLEVASKLKPDIILCHLAENMLLALQVQKYLKIPIVLHVEIASKIALVSLSVAGRLCSLEY